MRFSESNDNQAEAIDEVCKNSKIQCPAGLDLQARVLKSCHKIGRIYLITIFSILIFLWIQTKISTLFLIRNFFNLYFLKTQIWSSDSDPYISIQVFIFIYFKLILIKFMISSIEKIRNKNLEWKNWPVIFILKKLRFEKNFLTWIEAKLISCEQKLVLPNQKLFTVNWRVGLIWE